MMSWFLTNYKLICLGIAILAVFIGGWTVNGWRWQTKLEIAVEEQKKADSEQCTADKKLTEESSREYTNKITDLTRRLANAKRLLPSRCIMPVTGETPGGNGEASGNIHSGQNGVTTDALIDLAGECEHYRLQVISLQDFIDGVWKR